MSAKTTNFFTIARTVSLMTRPSRATAMRTLTLAAAAVMMGIVLHPARAEEDNQGIRYPSFAVLNEIDAYAMPATAMTAIKGKFNLFFTRLTNPPWVILSPEPADGLLDVHPQYGSIFVLPGDCGCAPQMWNKSKEIKGVRVN